MTDKQQLFVQEYIASLNATQSAVKAGYSKRTAYSIGQRLLKNVEIQEAINSAINERQARTEVTADYVITSLYEVAERCMQAKPVIVKGQQITDEQGNNLWCFDAKNAIKSLELLGKHLGLFTEKHTIQADLGISTLADLMIDEWQQAQSSTGQI